MGIKRLSIFPKGSPLLPAVLASTGVPPNPLFSLSFFASMRKTALATYFTYKRSYYKYKFNLMYDPYTAAEPTRKGTDEIKFSPVDTNHA